LFFQGKQPECLDACVCLLAAADFLTGQAATPETDFLYDAEKEG
jgi:hypothetical protein